MIRSRSYLFLIIIVLPLFEHGPRRTSGRSLKLRPEDVLTLIRRMTENCSKDGPNTRQLHVCPADPCPLIENDPIMSCLYEGSAEITIFQSLGRLQPSTSPMWRSPQLGHAQVRALINRTLPDIMLCHWIARFASIRYSVLSSSEVLSRSDRTNFF